MVFPGDAKVAVAVVVVVVTVAAASLRSFPARNTFLAEAK